MTKYIPEVVPNNLKLCERDGLLTYNDQLKYERFTQDPDKYLEKTEVFNFGMICSRCRRDKKTFSGKYFQTVFQSNVQKLSQKERKKVVSACLRSHRKDIFVEKILTLSHFLGEKDEEL